jgi:DNA-directed RNA polymerase subunit RPC12/RpoP
LNGEILGTFSLTGELYYSQDDNTIYKLDEIHIYEQEIISEVTCITDGEVLYTCTDCDENYTLIIPAHNHKYDNDRNAICDDCGEKIEYIDVHLDSEYMWFLFGDVNSVTDIIIPEGIETICKNAFSYCKSLKNITLPSTLTYIDYDAFYEGYGTSNLGKVIKIKAKIPPRLYNYSSLVYNINNLSKLIVPKGCLDAYKKASNWSAFASKMEESTEW